MATRKRDHKAEYAARKRKATDLGYGSVRKYRTARSEFNPPRRANPPTERIARIRRESKRWSDTHSLVKNSRYRPELSDEAIEAYHAAFVAPDPRRDELPPRLLDFRKRKRIHDYYVPYLMDEKEWSHVPSLVPLRR